MPDARRGPSPCPAAAQPAVEVGRRLQEPVPLRLELVLLEEEVLADAGVERLDRFDRQIVPRLHGGPGAGQVVVGGGQGPVGGGQGLVGGRLAPRRVGDRGLGRVWITRTADSPMTPATTAAAAPVTTVRLRFARRARRESGSRYAVTGSSAIQRSMSSASARQDG